MGGWLLGAAVPPHPATTIRTHASRTTVLTKLRRYPRRRGSTPTRAKYGPVVTAHDAERSPPTRDTSPRDIGQAGWATSVCMYVRWSGARSVLIEKHVLEIRCDRPVVLLVATRFNRAARGQADAVGTGPAAKGAKQPGQREGRLTQDQPSRDGPIIRLMAVGAIGERFLLRTFWDDFGNPRLSVSAVGQSEGFASSAACCRRSRLGLRAALGMQVGLSGRRSSIRSNRGVLCHVRLS